MEGREMQCKFCLKKFTSQQEWKQHVRSKHNAKVFMCELCPVVYYSKNEYMEHYDAAHKSDFTRHTCSYCGVSYKWFKFLQKHIQKLHSIDKLIECTKCGEEFYNSMAYERHVKLKHAPGRKFHKCNKCFRSFTAKAFVHLHQKFDHNTNGLKNFRGYVLETLDLPEEFLTSMKKCVKCDLKFSSALYLYKHFKYAHNKTKFYKCCKCDEAIYNSKSGLGIHMHFEHGVSREHSCSKCSIGYSKLPKKSKIAEVRNEINNKSNDQVDKSNDLPPWSKLFVKEALPDDLELTNATDEEVNNLKSNIKMLFHILSTIPPSQLKGKANRDRTESLFSINKLRGLHRENKRIYDSSIIQELKLDEDKLSSDNNETVKDNANESTEKNQKINGNIVKKLKKSEKEAVTENLVKNNQKYKAHFQCNECHKTFSLKIALDMHMAQKHGSTNATCVTNGGEDTKGYSGIVCEAAWPLLDTTAGCATEHDLLIEISSTKPDQNNTASDIYIPNTNGNYHVTNYICNICQIEFDDQIFLLNHLTEAHSNAENSDTVYKCVACNDAFSSEESLNVHMRAHFQISEPMPMNLPNKCDKCNKSFSDKRGLYLHQLRSHGIKNTYSCKKCNFKHSNKRKLRNHPCVPNNTIITDTEFYHKEKENNDTPKQIDYTNIKKELLKMCKKELDIKKRELSKSKRLYKCLKCDKKFPKRALLLSHIRNDHQIHLFKIHKCEKCCAVFKMEDKLQQHIKLKHRPAPKMPVLKISKAKMSPIKIDDEKLPTILSNIFHKNGMMFNCKICQSFFPSNELLQRHIQWEHTTNVNLHKCGQCNQVLYSVEDLELHVNNTHNNDGIRNWKKKIVINYEQQTDV